MRGKHSGIFGALGGLLLTSGAAFGQLYWGTDGSGGTGTWNGTSANWWNGTSAVKWSPGEAVFAGPGGIVTMGSGSSVTASQLTFLTPGYDLEGFLLHGAAGGLTVDAQADATIGADIFDMSVPAFQATFTKTGLGLLTMTNAPAFYGTITVQKGELRFADGGSLNGTSTYVLADDPSAILSFTYDGEAVTNLAGGGASGGIVRPASPSADPKTLTIYGGGATFSGSLQDNGATTLGIEKNAGAGPGTTQTLAGANTYSGATTVSGGTLAFAGNGSAQNTSALTIRRGGTLLLDETEKTTLSGRFSATAPVSLQGGALSMVCATPTFENLGALTISGAASVSVDLGSASDARFIFASLQRTANGTLHITGDRLVALNWRTATNTNGIFGAHVTIGDDWAVLNSLGGVDAFTGYSNYASNITTAAATANVQILGGQGLTASATRNSLKLGRADVPSSYLYLPTGVILSITSGGILSAGSARNIIEGGGMLTSAANELIVTTFADLTILPKITNTGGAPLTLTKTGAGTLTLTGAHSYTGSTVINEGVIEASADASLGTGSTIMLNGGTLRALGNFTSQKKLVSSTGLSGTIDTNGHNLTFYGAHSVALTKVGAGVLTLGMISSSSLSATVNEGTLSLLSAKSGTVTLNAAHLQTSGTLDTVYSNGGGRISPGGALTIRTLQLNAPTTFEFNLGNAGTPDFIAVTSEFRNFAGGPAAAQFNFIPLDDLELGRAYALMSLAGFTVPANTASFALAPELVAAGWQAAFTLANGATFSDPKTLSVTFMAVPEPSALLLLAVGAGFCGLLRPPKSRRHRETPKPSPLEPARSQPGRRRNMSRRPRSVIFSIFLPKKSRSIPLRQEAALGKRRTHSDRCADLPPCALLRA